MFKNKFTTYTVLFIVVWVHLLADVIINDKTILWLLLSVLLYIALLLRGVFDIKNNYFFKSALKLQGFKLVLNNAQLQYKSVNEIALTFDDGPDPTTTPKILDLLKKHDIKASFFVIGKQAKAHPDLIKRILEEGHSIGLHSWNHDKNGPFKSTAIQIEEYSSLQNLLQTEFDYFTRLARPPFGITNPNISKAYEHLGLQSIGWSLRSLDTKQKDATSISKRVIKKLRPNQIVLLHDDLPLTLEALPVIIEHIQSKGWDFVNLEIFNQQ